VVPLLQVEIAQTDLSGRDLTVRGPHRQNDRTYGVGKTMRPYRRRTSASKLELMGPADGAGQAASPAGPNSAMPMTR
jgi:hypothetical protein